MAINLMNLYGLNKPEATIVRQKIQPSTLRLDLDTVKTNWEQIKSESKDLVMISGEAQVTGKTVSQNDIDGLGDLKRTVSYSSDVFFQRDMPRTPSGDNEYIVGGVSFSKEELEKCRMVMKTAAENIGCGIGKGTDIDYKNYAQMGIATSCVKTFAENNLTEEQAVVLNKAMEEYNQALIDFQNQTYEDGNYVDTPYANQADYYGKARVLSDGEIEVINKLKEEISRLTGRYMEPSRKGMVASTPSATNETLIGKITDLFSDIDCNSVQDINAAAERYKDLMEPAYIAYGMNDEHGSLSKVLEADVEYFKNQVSNMLNVMKFHPINLSV